MHTSQYRQSFEPGSQPRGRGPGLGAVAAVILVVAPQAPLGRLMFGMSPNFDATGVLGFPLIYAAVGVALLAFGVAASAMARQVSHPGGLYAFVSHGLGRPAGLGAALVGLIGYSAMPVTFLVPIGDQTSQLLAKHTGVTLPWWVLAVPAVLAMGVLGTWRIQTVVRLLGGVLAAQLLLIAVFDVATLAQPGPEGVSTAALNPASLLSSGVGPALAFVLVGFVGFEIVASYTGELRRSRLSANRVAYLSVGLMAAIYALSCWALTAATGPSHVVEQARSLRIALVPSLIESRLGPTTAALYSALVLVSVFAAALAFHNVAARYLGALARDGVLPRALASMDPGAGASAACSGVQIGVTLALVLVTGVSGADPTATLFLWMSDIGTLGICFVLILAALAIVAFFLRSDAEEWGFLGWEGPVVAGVFSVVTLTLLVILALTQFDVRLSVPADSPLGYLPPALLTLLFVTGVVWATVLRTTRPQTFLRIGHSPASGPGESTGPTAAAGATAAGHIGHTLTAGDPAVRFTSRRRG